jgi:hypothetical protein
MYPTEHNARNAQRSTAMSEKPTQSESVSQATIVEAFASIQKTLEALRGAIPNPKQEAEEAAERLTYADRFDADGTPKPPLVPDVFLIDGTSPHRWQLRAGEIALVNELFEKGVHGRFAGRRVEVIRREDHEGTSFEIRKPSGAKIANGEHISFFTTYAPSLTVMLQNILQEFQEQKKARRADLLRELKADDEQ